MFCAAEIGFLGCPADWLAVIMILPIAYVTFGAAVLATLDWDGEFFRFCRQRDSVVLAIMLWPISAWAILSGRRKRSG